MATINLVAICIVPFGGPESVRPNGTTKPLEYGEQFTASSAERLAELIGKGRAVASEHFEAHDAERKEAIARLRASDKAQVDVRDRVNALMAQASAPTTLSNTAAPTTPAASTAAAAVAETYDINKTVKEVLADVKNDVISAYDALQLELSKGNDSRTTLVTELQDIIDANNAYDVAAKSLDEILADIDAGLITAVDAASLEQARASEARTEVVDMLATLLETV